MFIQQSLARALPIFSSFQQPFLPKASFLHHLNPTPPPKTLPGGTPFSLCPASNPTDLFAIKSLELTKQPVYIDDIFLIHLYGTFQHTFSPNATINLKVDCGSHCEEYGNPPGESPSETVEVDFCEVSEIDQPLGRKSDRNGTCPPEKGYALLSSAAYVVPMFFSTPGWYNFTFEAQTQDGERIYCVTAEVCLRWEDEKKNENYPPGPWNECRWPR
ncbi:hypothetical protein Q7P37_009659 [Cladosporium fusiforme]